MAKIIRKGRKFYVTVNTDVYMKTILYCYFFLTITVDFNRFKLIFCSNFQFFFILIKHWKKYIIKIHEEYIQFSIFKFEIIDTSS